MNCPTCGGPVEKVGDRSYVHAQPEPVNLDGVKVRAIEDFWRVVEARLRAQPKLGWQRVVRDELKELRRLLGEELKPAV